MALHGHHAPRIYGILSLICELLIVFSLKPVLICFQWSMWQMWNYRGNVYYLIRISTIVEIDIPCLSYKVYCMSSHNRKGKLHKFNSLALMCQNN